MPIDPENPTVKLCAQGIEAEMNGNHDQAGKLYQQAWEISTNDYESCIAAHYLARLQTAPSDSLHWNLQALLFADKVGDERVATFYPSLYLNVGKAYEDSGNASEAKRHYQLGLGKTSALPDDRLGNITRDGLMNGLARVSN
jgi:tetratricopeptide (TPR) repeat protein